MIINNKQRRKFLYSCILATSISIFSTVSLTPSPSKATPATSSEIKKIAGNINLDPDNLNYKNKTNMGTDTIFEDVVFTNGSSAKKVIVSKDEQTKRKKIIIEGMDLKQTDSTVSIGEAIIIFDNAKALKVNKKTDKKANTKNNQFSESIFNNFNGDVFIKNISMQLSDEEKTKLEIAQLDLIGIKSEKYFNDVKSVNISKFSMMNDETTFSFGNFNMNNVGKGYFLYFIPLAKNEKPYKISFSDFAIGKISLEKFELLLKEFALSSNKSTTKITLDNFLIDDFNQNNLKEFLVKGFSFASTANTKNKDNKFNNIFFNVGEFDIQNFNVNYIAKAVENSLKTNSSKADADNKLYVSQYLKHGPLDFGADFFKLANINFEAFGLKGGLDNITTDIVRDNNGINTYLGVKPFNMYIKAIDKKSNDYKKIEPLFKAFKSDTISLNAQGSVKYDVAGDYINYENNSIKISNFGTLTANGKFSNIKNWWSNIYVPKNKNAALYLNKTPPMLNDTLKTEYMSSSIKAFKDIYKNLYLNEANISFKNEGANDVIAKIAEKNKKTIAKELSTNAKNAAPIQATTINGIAKLMEKGGTLNIDLKPTQPVEFTKLLDKNTKPEEIGLKVTNKTSFFSW